ncbi:MAG: cytochrome c oxidase subunit II [Actinobacteria bacterium]|nr:cytochrome c oxidase subunit II [Actinomycetota bacterium]
MKRLWAGALAIGALTGACSRDSSILHPAGATAERLAGLWWLMLWLGAAVWVLVIAVLVRAAAAPRPNGDAAAGGGGRGLVIGGGILLPVVVLVPLVFVVFQVAEDLSPRPTGDDIRIEVVGQQYWWEVRYSGTDAVDANEVHVPIGRPVVLELSSTDVIHSFWVPQLAGKQDVFPGDQRNLTLEASEPGRYEGQCAEFCGISHSRMRLRVIAQSPEDFDAWAADQLREQPAPAAGATGDVAEGAALFQSRGCGGCHTVAGYTEGEIGPNLTHLYDRATFAGSIFELNSRNLRRWLRDPQAEKPGNKMELPVQLTEDEITKLIAYLETLK